MTLPNYQTAFLTLLIPFLISCGGGGGGSALEIPTVTPSFNVSAASGDNGSISPSMVSVVQGQTATFTVAPETGYSVLSVSGCNGTLSDNTFTTGTILAACTVTVQYAKYMSTVFEAVAYEFPYPSITLDSLCIENPTAVGAATSILLPVDLNLDTFNDLVVSYFCGPKISGQYLDTPTPDAIIAFKNNGDQTFSIANSEVFGSETIQLGGATRKGVLADFNGDKYLDILYALNREDGRGQSCENCGASNEAPQKIILSNGDGTYAVTELGFSEWTHAVDAVQMPSGNYDAVISGFRNNTVTGLRYIDGSMQEVSDYANPGGPVNRFGASTLRFLPELTPAAGSMLAVSDSGDCGIQVNLSSFSKASGAWSFVDKTDFNCRTISNAYEGYTNELGDLPLITIDGQDYTGGGFGNEESCILELTPGDAPVAVVQFSAQPIVGNYVEGVVYKQGDLPVQNRLNVFDVSDTGLVLKTGVVVNEKIDALYRIDACRDINNDGYDDVVLLQNAGGGGEATNTRAEPIIYLNDKENHLVKLDLAGIPLVDKSEDYLVHGFLADMNGDGIEDLVYFRASRGYISSDTLDPRQENFIRVYWGIKNLKL
ncbi:VCBS repeat-containing protein [Gammaproteobacteria bacterium]|nr:VCBS repeat-containing protein [Gammaproteobacteria bacterium]